MRRTWFILLLLTTATLVGCSTNASTGGDDATIEPTIEIRGGASPPATEVEPSPPTEEIQEEAIVTEEPPEALSYEYDPALQPLVDMALEDLSDRLKVDLEQIIVVEAELVVWPDASLGCPQPDMIYTQVPVDGTLISLSVANQVYEYHGGGWTDPFLCEGVIKTKPTTPKIDLTISTPPPRDTGDK